MIPECNCLYPSLAFYRIKAWNFSASAKETSLMSRRTETAVLQLLQLEKQVLELMSQSDSHLSLTDHWILQGNISPQKNDNQ